MSMRTFNKAAAQDFLQEVATGDVRKAFERYVGPVFKHHNGYFKGDQETLMQAMEQNTVENPAKVFKIHHTIEEGEMVAVHSLIQMSPEDIGMAVVHILRFDNRKIVEFWDVGQPVPKDPTNENGMF